MDEFETLPLDVRLSAYLDGQVDDQQRAALEDLLASDDEARALLETLKAGSDFGNQAFEDMLKDPVPLHLVRAIKDAGAKPAASGGNGPANNNVVSYFRFLPQAIAASAVLLLAGGYSGYFLGKSASEAPMVLSETSGLTADAPANAVKTRGLTFEAPVAAEPAGAPVTKGDIALMEIAGLHKVYSVDKTHADEVPASQQGELIGWLEAVTAVKFTVPDLSSEGLTFRGGKLAAAVGQPTGALFYEDSAGAVVGVYFMKNADIKGMAPGQDGFAVIGGQKAETSYFIAAPDEALARKLENSVKAAL